MEERPIFDEEWTIRGNITNDKKIDMFDRLKDGIGYVD